MKRKRLLDLLTTKTHKKCLIACRHIGAAGVLGSVTPSVQFKVLLKKCGFDPQLYVLTREEVFVKTLTRYVFLAEGASSVVHPVSI
jgi:hypothetical protein